jgi:hypothetical protein
MNLMHPPYKLYHVIIRSDKRDRTARIAVSGVTDNDARQWALHDMEDDWYVVSHEFLCTTPDFICKEI